MMTARIACIQPIPSNDGKKRATFIQLVMQVVFKLDANGYIGIYKKAVRSEDFLQVITEATGVA
jgi:hypothetical protein